MRDAGLSGFTGACAALGGASWTAASIVHASQPRGCVGEECVAMPMREATAATSLLVGLAGVMLLASGAGLLLLISKRRRLGRIGVIGAAACCCGVLLLAVASGVQELFYDGDFAGMPLFVGPGVAALVVGLALVGWTVVRSRVLPRWAGVSLVVGALLLLGANEQTAAVLLAVPFGVAWLATGATLVLRSREEASRDGAA